MEKSKVKVIVIIVSTVLLCGVIAGTAAIISGCNRKNTVNSTENSSTSSAENNTTSEDVTTTEDSKETSADEKTSEDTEADTEASQESTEDETASEGTDETSTSPQSTVAPTVAPTKAPQSTTEALTEAPTKVTQPTTVAPTVAPTKAPEPTTAAPTEPATTVAPTQASTEEPTTAPVIRSINGRIIDTIYFHFPESESKKLSGVWKLPETREEFVERVRDGDPDSDVRSVAVWDKSKINDKDFFGIGFEIGVTTMEEMRAYYGEPYAIRITSFGTALFYEYKVEDLILTLVYKNEDNSWYSVDFELREDVDYLNQ